MRRKDPKVERWSTHPYLRDLGRRQLVTVCTVGDEIALPVGSRLVTRGGAASFFYLVLSGCVVGTDGRSLAAVGYEVCVAGMGMETATVEEDALVLCIATRHRELVVSTETAVAAVQPLLVAGLCSESGRT